MRNSLAVLIVIVALEGCAEFHAAQNGVKTHGAEIADAELDTAEWGVCKAATIGAWMRRYGSDDAKIKGWRDLCGTTIKEAPVPTEPAIAK